MSIVTFRNSMIQIYGEYYFKFHSDEVFDERKYLGAKSGIGRNVLNTFYNLFVGVDIEPIESLSKEKKEFYWEISKKFCTTKEEMVKCSKSMYVLDYITNNT